MAAELFDENGRSRAGVTRRVEDAVTQLTTESTSPTVDVTVGEQCAVATGAIHDTRDTSETSRAGDRQDVLWCIRVVRRSGSILAPESGSPAIHTARRQGGAVAGPVADERTHATQRSKAGGTHDRHRDRRSLVTPRVRTAVAELSAGTPTPAVHSTGNQECAVPVAIVGARDAHDARQRAASRSAGHRCRCGRFRRDAVAQFTVLSLTPTVNASGRENCAVAAAVTCQARYATQRATTRRINDRHGD